jgi:hypothetical protein
MLTPTLNASATEQSAEPRFFSSHQTIQANSISWLRGPSTMQYVVKGIATPTLSETGELSLAIEDFTVKVLLTPADPIYLGWTFEMRDFRDRVFPATYDADAGVYRVRADARFLFFPTPFGGTWAAGWTGIMLSFVPGGPITVTPEVDHFEDWWFL